MANNWRHMLDDDYEDRYEKIERIPHPPRKEQTDKVKNEQKKVRQPTQNPSKK